MSIIPPHMQAQTKQDCIDTWRSRGRVPVPTRAGAILDLLIERIYETTRVDTLPLDLLMEARATRRAPLKRFGVVFADSKPLHDYPIPVLWMRDGVGTWVGRINT